MIRAFLVWLQNDLGKGSGDSAQSWSEALLGSLNFWGLLEGTHLLTLMLFVGTIFIVDLRLLGVVFRRTPISIIEKKVLPLTFFGFALMVITGLSLFFAKPVAYYHNIWFRAKLVFLALAVINIVVFHVRVQRSQAVWDQAPSPPLSVKASAGASLALWILVILMGRLIAYSWFECGNPMSDFMNWAESCAQSDKGATPLGAK